MGLAIRRTHHAGMGTDVQQERARRVRVLILGIVALSAADLVVTLGHLKTIGMAEANPIAAYLISSTGSAWVLSLYKFITMGVCVCLIHRLRFHRQGELAAWLAMLILTMMSIQWQRYTHQLKYHDPIQLAQSTVADGHWLTLD